MMKKKTTKRVSNSNRLSPSYRFFRSLKDEPTITTSFNDRNDRINRVRPVKDILVINTFFAPDALLDVGKTSPAESITYDTFPITKDQKEWPFRIEYIEQLLEVDHIWVVVVQPYYQDPTIGPLAVSNMSIDIVHIDSPCVICQDTLGYTPGPPILTEKGLIDLEKEIGITGRIGEVCIYSRNSNTNIDITHCNILPYGLKLYNATFYHKDVAQLYVDSLSTHLARHN